MTLLQIREKEIFMEKQTYITDIERERCQKIAGAYSELYETDNLVVLDAGRYGFVMLQYYNKDYGFDDMFTYTNSRDLFESLWKEWLDTQLLTIARGTPMEEMDYDDIFKCLPKEKQQELMERRMYFAETAGMPEYGVDTDET